MFFPLHNIDPPLGVNLRLWPSVFLYLISVQDEGSHCDRDSSAMASNLLGGGDILAPVQLTVAIPTMLGYDVSGGESDILPHQKHLALFRLCTG